MNTEQTLGEKVYSKICGRLRYLSAKIRIQGGTYLEAEEPLHVRSEILLNEEEDLLQGELLLEHFAVLGRGFLWKWREKVAYV